MTAATEDLIEHEENGQRGTFFIRRDGRRVAEMTCTGSASVRIRLLPLCPFAKSGFDKTPDSADVL